MTNEQPQDTQITGIKQLQARHMVKRLNRDETISHILLDFPEEEHEMWRALLSRVHITGLLHQMVKLGGVTQEQAKELEEHLTHISLHYMDSLDSEHKI